MNSSGRLFRIHVLGESHGKCVGVLIDGCPAGLSINDHEFVGDLARRQGGSVGTTPRVEPDVPVICSGVFEGKTTGAPVLITFDNKCIDSSPYEDIRHLPRPGHADFVAAKKFLGCNDYRGGGHFSGRLTVALVAAAVIAKKLIQPIRVEAHVVEAGGSKDVVDAVDVSLKEGDSIGGIVECRATGLPIGLGEPFFDSVESLISHLAFSIGGVRGIEFGSGFACARMRGSACNDSIIDGAGTTETNHAGGVNGGLTNGNELVYRVAVKPTSSIAKPQQTIDMKSGMPTCIEVRGRHDTCIALRVPVILEAVTAIVLADLTLIQQKISRTQ